VLIAPDGTAKLTDFGVSVIMTNNMDTVLPPGPNDTCATLRLSNLQHKPTFIV
jgi:hypothetical protein